MDTAKRTSLEEFKTLCSKRFKLEIDVSHIVFADIRVGKSVYMTIAETAYGELYALFISSHSLSLRDVLKATKRSGLVGIKLFAPHRDNVSFEKAGLELLKQTFPGRKSWTKKEKIYYVSLTEYKPGLLRISSEIDHLNHFNSLTGQWQELYGFREVAKALSKEE